MKFNKGAKIDKKIRVNEAIYSEKVLLIDKEGKSCGPTPLTEAINKAKKAGLDLVEVAPNANPPVARIIDFGKYLYQREKNLQKQKKHKIGSLKEVRFGLKTSTHDREIKINRARKFLEKKHKVKINLKLVGREMAFLPRGFALIDEIAKSLADVGNPEEKPQKERNIISVTINPK